MPNESAAHTKASNRLPIDAAGGANAGLRRRPIPHFSL
jgi:hypothetical protein